MHHTKKGKPDIEHKYWNLFGDALRKQGSQVHFCKVRAATVATGDVTNCCSTGGSSSLRMACIASSPHLRFASFFFSPGSETWNSVFSHWGCWKAETHDRKLKPPGCSWVTAQLPFWRAHVAFEHTSDILGIDFLAKISAVDAFPASLLLSLCLHTRFLPYLFSRSKRDFIDFIAIFSSACWSQLGGF